MKYSVAIDFEFYSLIEKNQTSEIITDTIQQLLGIKM